MEGRYEVAVASGTRACVAARASRAALSIRAALSGRAAGAGRPPWRVRDGPSGVERPTRA
jgi:hypothetical protein